MDVAELERVGDRVDKGRLLATKLGDLRRAKNDIKGNQSLEVTFDVPGTSGGSHAIYAHSCGWGEELRRAIVTAMDTRIAELQAELESL